MDSIPAIVENKYNKGISYLLASSGFLHPVNDGGYWSEKQIEGFYNYVVDEYNEANKVNVELNPWPDGQNYAFCVTLNSQGTIDQYKRIFSLLKKESIKPTIFVNGLSDREVMKFLKSSKNPLASSGYSYSNYQNLRYPGSVEDILRNTSYWDTDFRGFRFPYTSPGFWGMLALDKNNYLYESSIGANNLEFIHGSVFPYNIVVANNGYFKSTDILEIAPTYHDDYYFLQEIYSNQNTSSVQVDKISKIYTKYLDNYWNYAVKPYRGLMVFLGHPQYVGYNDTTAAALSNLIKIVRQDKAWVTTIDEIASFRKDLSKLQFYVENSKNKQSIKIEAPEGTTVEGVCLNLNQKVNSASVKEGKVKISENGGGSKLIFNAFDGQVVTITY